MNIIQEQFNDMLSRGIIPYIEYPVLIDGQEEWLTVKLETTEEGIKFSFDCFGLSSHFDGNIIAYHDCAFLLPYSSNEDGENDHDHLDDYLYLIDSNLREGFMLVHNIDREEV